MDNLRQYVLTMVIAALICAVVVSILPERAGKQRMVRMICGLFMLVAACKPLGQIVLDAGDLSLDTFRTEAQLVQQAAEIQTDKAMSSVITNQTETYIEDKANALGAAVSAEVSLDGGLLPWQVKLTGEVSPYVKTRLTQTISTELGIPAERQVWLP